MSSNALQLENEDVLESELMDLTRNCLLHATLVLIPQGVKLPASGTHRIQQFCQDLLNIIHASPKSPKGTKKSKKKKGFLETTLIPEVEILKFYEGVTTPQEFTLIVSRALIQICGPDLDESDIHKLCWEYYSNSQKADIAYPKWLNFDTSYLLWLVFCSLLASLNLTIDSTIMNEILQRLFALGGYSWNDGFTYTEKATLDFPAFLEVLTSYFGTLALDVSLVAEVIYDLKDEIVDGVLRKGYLEKKGHRVPNWKRRWFVLKRDSLVYYDSRDKLVEKGRIMLASQTLVNTLEDKGPHKHMFFVRCSGTGIDYEISADDNRSRNEWLLAIKKAIQLEQAIHKDNIQEFTQSLASFYQLKYGTPCPNLSRIDSTIRRATMSGRQRKAKTLTATCSLGNGVTASHLSTDGIAKESNSDPDTYYLEMTGDTKPVPPRDDDDDGYMFMFQGKNTDIDLALRNDVSGPDTTYEDMVISTSELHDHSIPCSVPKDSENTKTCEVSGIDNFSPDVPPRDEKIQQTHEEENYPIHTQPVPPPQPTEDSTHSSSQDEEFYYITPLSPKNKQ